MRDANNKTQERFSSQSMVRLANCHASVTTKSRVAPARPHVPIKRAVGLLIIVSTLSAKRLKEILREVQPTVAQRWRRPGA